MNNETILKIGIDLADQKHDYCMIISGRYENQAGSVSSDPAVLYEWIKYLRKITQQDIF